MSGGQDKLIYVHKPGDTQPSHVLIGHESNVINPLYNLADLRFAHCTSARMEPSFQEAGISTQELSF